MIPIGRAIASGLHKRVAAVLAAQSAKTETMLDVVGARLDLRPAPILYVGPTLKWITEQLEPRVMTLLDEAETLAKKVARGKRMTKTRKVIAGVPLRLAHGGSSSALKSDPAALAIVDEYVELLKHVSKQGRVLELVEARGDTYADFTMAIISTPSRGVMDIERDPVSGLQFWKIQEGDDVECPMWRLWQQGTRYHWCWQCPNCGGWFVPRFDLLHWPDDASPMEALRDAWLECPNDGCGGVLIESDKAAMNERGVYVAPGQTVDEDGNVAGLPPDAFPSYWASGICTPFRTFGERAQAIVQARDDSDPNAEMTVINAAFGELWAPVGGETPAWQEVAKCKGGYGLCLVNGEPSALQLPVGAVFMTAAVDVQMNRLIYGVRAWGARGTSWLVAYGELYGSPAEWEVWEDLGDLLTSPIGGRRIRLALVDTGFRADKKDQVPVTAAYDFCRRYQRICKPAKGSSMALGAPMRLSKMEIAAGKTSKFGLELVRIDTDQSKLYVHEKVRWTKDRPGAWFIGDDTSDDYCKQIVSEARVRTPETGRPAWIPRSKNNHALDIEAMNYVAGYMLNAHRLPARVETKKDAPPDDSVDDVLAERVAQQPGRRQARVIRNPMIGG